MILRTFFFAAGIYCLHWNTHCGLKFHFGQFDRSEICIEVSFITPEVMRTMIMKLPHTQVKFYREMKSQTGLSSLRVSCKRALRRRNLKWWIERAKHLLCEKIVELKVICWKYLVVILFIAGGIWFTRMVHVKNFQTKPGNIWRTLINLEASQTIK